MKNHKGFTLIELMIAVAIIGILVAIALPNYQRYILKSHRSAAINAVMELASRQARYYTTNNTYTTSLVTLGYAADPMPVASSTEHYYDLSVSAVNATSYTVSAAPSGGQTKDTCGTYSYTDLGIKSVSSGSMSDCWKQ